MTACARCEDRSAIELLMTEYARRLDAGDLEAFAELFRHGTWHGNHGYAETLDWLRRRVIFYEGETRTLHAMSNVAIDVDASRATAAATCYITVLQRAPDDDAVKIITANSYVDRFVKAEDGWRFDERVVTRRVVGDTGKHLRSPDGGAR